MSDAEKALVIIEAQMTADTRTDLDLPARGTDKAITDAIDRHVETEQGRDDDDGSALRDVPHTEVFWLGAGDENRTRTVSLGICAVVTCIGPDLRCDGSVSDRE
jgi:hypothetical protein